ncbi:tryptophan synthase subunit alpha [Litchfieldia salsa]|uniref:Tryptophan synthase alpha chain n=1 Tax=Litchfieldia salsa TaxID=930152 RepID=A0A1H0WEQ2_9BACI|nr:tryptophan synthase subunit alpha [Litchfieldia salsa]SDP89269.1 tryptophan synthase, alpha chain [Litchfieldia salsa]
MNTTFNERLPKVDHLFIPFIVAGDPHPDVTIELALALQEAGASVLELGIPYSDPLADGPIIQRASQRALKNNMTLEQAMNLVGKMREKGLNIPVVVFTYYNPVLQLGEDRFFTLAHKNGVDGLLVPDLPYEESEHLREECQQQGIKYISLVAPTSSKRIEKIANNAQGFLYCVSSLGVTGVRDTLNEDVLGFLTEVKQYSKIPVAVGFGISNADHVRLLQDHCDGIVIGSAIVRKIEELNEALLLPTSRQKALVEFKGYVETIIAPIKPCEV